MLFRSIHDMSPVGMGPRLITVAHDMHGFFRRTEVQRMAEAEPALAQLVKLRYFTGLTIEETAKVLKVSPRTVKRDWTYARAWLRRTMEGNEEKNP